jgi:hypothetical protein
LVRLQELDLEARELEKIQSGMPSRLAELESEFNARVEEIGGARLRHEQLVQRRDELTKQLEETNDRLARAQQKLMHVSNQREYSAALNEIDSMKTDVSRLESEILEIEEEIEQLAGPAAEADERIAVERSKLEEAKHRLEEEARELATRLQAVSEDRGQLVSELPAGHVSKFEKLARLRDGLAMARVVTGACSACHVKLRPQVVSLVRRGEELVSCESCGRLLYIDENLGEEPAPAPAEDSGAADTRSGQAPPEEPGAEGGSGSSPAANGP